MSDLRLPSIGMSIDEFIANMPQGNGPLNEKMGVVITEISPERIVATMPVEGNTQPYGLLHGGASVDGSAGAWIVTCGVGMVNTTLHHEHGLLAALLLGLWLSTLSPRRASS